MDEIAPQAPSSSSTTTTLLKLSFRQAPILPRFEQFFQQNFAI
jgi:hypothetical protein